jgi:hypothetical protein
MTYNIKRLPVQQRQILAGKGHANVWFRVFRLVKSTILEVRNVEHAVLGEIYDDILEMLSQGVNPSLLSPNDTWRGT